MKTKGLNACKGSENNMNKIIYEQLAPNKQNRRSSIGNAKVMNYLFAFPFLTQKNTLAEN